MDWKYHWKYFTAMFCRENLNSSNPIDIKNKQIFCVQFFSVFKGVRSEGRSTVIANLCSSEECRYC